MAYVSQEMKKELAPQIKAVLKKYKVKGSIKVSNHSTLCVNLKSGEVDFAMDQVVDEGAREGAKRKFHYQINPYWFTENYCGNTNSFLTELFAAMKGDKWYDRSDAQTDYFDTAYYVAINAGAWDKDYEVTV